MRRLSDAGSDAGSDAEGSDDEIEGFNSDLDDVNMDDFTPEERAEFAELAKMFKGEGADAGMARMMSGFKLDDLHDLADIGTKPPSNVLDAEWKPAAGSKKKK